MLLWNVLENLQLCNVSSFTKHCYSNNICWQFILRIIIEIEPHISVTMIWQLIFELFFLTWQMAGQINSIADG